jgi:DNA polymerase III epsilon subunit family exonuclease
MSYKSGDWIECKNAKAALKEFDSGIAFIALDFETTGLSAVDDRVTEIGAVKFNRDGILGEFGSLCDPGRPIGPDASRVSGITDSMVRGQASVRELMDELYGFLRICPIVAHNAPFDVGFILQDRLRIGSAALENGIYDTRLLAKEAYPGLPRYSLQELNARLGVDPGNAHRALDDAKACMEIFLKCLERLRAPVARGAPLSPGAPPATEPRPDQP